MDPQHLQALGNDMLGQLAQNPLIGGLFYLTMDALRRIFVRFKLLAKLADGEGARATAFVLAQIFSAIYTIWHLVPWGAAIEHVVLGGVGIFVSVGVAKPVLDRVRDVTPGLPTGTPAQTGNGGTTPPEG